jgi:hypothetical protein
MPTGTAEHLSQGNATIARIEELVQKPKALKEPLGRFKAIQGKLQGAQDLVEATKKARDEALEAVGKKDDALDASVEALADALVATKVTKRQRPFGGLSRYSPSEMRDLPYATEAAAVGELCGEVEKNSPAAAVKEAAKRCRKDAKEVTAALKALLAPQGAYSAALMARDALLPDWQKAWKSLRTHAAVEWEDVPSMLKLIFAAPERVQQPKVKRAKAKTPAKEAPMKGTAAGG